LAFRRSIQTLRSRARSSSNRVFSISSRTSRASGPARGDLQAHVRKIARVHAAQELTAVGLTVAYREKRNTGQQPGTVVKIRPDAGTVVPEGSTVLLVIAS
jgi:beta-lactam-binding protein with PASTA domain